MAWEISISAEGWAALYAACHNLEKRDLVEAIGHVTGTDLIELMALPHDVLADQAFEFIETTNTCDDGGWWCWIDTDGYYKVHLPD